jgi:hypothetical protein
MSNKLCRSDWRSSAGVLAHSEHARVLIEQVEQFGGFKHPSGSTSSPFAQWALDENSSLSETFECVSCSNRGYVELHGDERRVEDRLVEQLSNDPVVDSVALDVGRPLAPRVGKFCEGCSQEKAVSAATVENLDEGVYPH